jgi:electron transfer flavoprotein alpha subunit
MNYIVLVKQVPDIRNIPPDAWDWEKGTLRRGMLDTVCNELDKQALAFTAALQKQQEGMIVALTMGPPFADEVLRYALSICADRAVLLTDRRLGGADTPATAYPLSQSIRKVEREFFDGNRDYLIITGMQSVDGDTAQVPPQVAEELGIPHIAYATSFRHADGALEVARITRIGKEVLSPNSYPALITVTNWTEPPFASFSRTAWAYDQDIVVWNADDVEADTARIGLTGSRTTVQRIFSPKEVSTKDCVYATDMRQLAEMIGQLYEAKLSAQGAEEDAGEQYRLPEDRTPTFRGEVWVYAEQDGGGLHAAAFELLGRASSIARSLNEKVAAVLLGAEVELMAADLIAHGADKVYVAEHEMLGHFSPMPFSKTVSELIGEYRPQIMLFAATPLGRELAPRIAYRTNSGLTADCTGLDLIDLKRAGKEYTGILRQTRPALGGNIMASIITQNADIQMSTARPGVMKAIPRDDSRRGEVVRHTPNLAEGSGGVRLVSHEPVQATAQLSEAGAIVSGGAGLRTRENYDTYVRPLAAELGRFLKVESMVGGSRAAVERGLIDRGHQVGQTGQTVKPRVYVAIGISGAVQHLTGMQSSDIIVAINKDAKAPIFHVADLGVVGSLEESIPQLIEALKVGAVQR